MGNRIEIALIGKPGCHLCDDARIALANVVEAFTAENPSVEIDVIERNILDDPQLALMHSEEIPVVLLNGKMHSYWHIDAARLKAALALLAE